MEALEDLLSDTDCEGHLNFRPSGQFSFASIRRQLENEGVEEEEEFEDEDLEEEQELDDNEGSDEDAQLTRGLWDISALGIGKNHDYLPQADELDEDEEFCEGQQLPSAFSEAPTALPDDAFSSRAPTKRPSLKEAEELQEDGDDHGDDEDFFPPFHRTPELANHWDISALGIDGKDTLEDDEGGLLHGNSVLLPSKSQGLQGLSLQPSEAAAPEAQKSGTGTPGSSTKRPFLKKGSRAKSTLPGGVPVVPPSRAAPTGPGSASQSVAPKKEIRKPVRPDPLDHFLANANLDSMGKAPVPPVLPKAADLEESFQKLPPKNAAATPLDQKDFDDSMPWDCRGDLDDLKLQEDEVDDLEGEPPTSDIVRSYFHPQRRPQRSAHWEGGDAFSTLYGRTSPGDGSLSGARQTEGRKGSKSETEQDQTEAKARLQALDEELKKYEKENENLKKLQAHAKQAERDIAREREKLWKEVEAERTALHAEFDVERAALRKERKRLAEVAERQRSQLREERENAEEKQRLTDRAEQLEEEMKEKEKRWQRTVDRLQRQVTEFTRKNTELQDEVQRLNQQVAQTQQSTWLKEVQTAKRGISARTKRANSVGPTQQTRDVSTKEKVEEKQPRNSVKSVPQAEKMQPSASSNDGELRETRKLDGRVERIFVDGRREVEFSNGLKKVMWPDGQTSVMFQNGDLKEIRSDGVVVYHYRATGAVQTTLTDGTELYQFSDGQTERHSLDGSKEIRFPNGTTKKIYSNGTEEVCFADGTIKTTPDKPPK